jgi:plasmid stabilization system protein ParE
MAQIVWSARAIKDIDEVAEYISKNSLVYAEEQVKQFFGKASILEQYPLYVSYYAAITGSFMRSSMKSV